MARIKVNIDSLDEAMFELECHGVFAIDTETTGLMPYKGDRIFSIIVSTYKDDFYFNYNTNAPAEYILPRKTIKRFRNLIANPDNIIYMHNAKFDMHMFHVEQLGFRFGAKIICTEAMSRLVHNQLPNYKLSTLGELIGFPKDDTVDKYISKHKLYTLVNVGKKKPRKDKHFDKVPYEIMSEYGLTDGRVTFQLGFYCDVRLKEINKEQTAIGLPSNVPLVENEIQLTKTLFKIESIGVKIDRAYCEEALEYEEEQYTEAMNKFYAFTDGIEFEDSPKCFKLAFKKLGLTPGITDKGNPSYSEENLPDNELTAIILQYRKSYKRAGTYFKNYLILADDNDVIHCNFRQGGTATGRMSSNNPNLQNVPKRDEDNAKYPVRRAFIPRPGKKFLMLDWDQQEYRQLLDVAGEYGLIKDILEKGLDVHTATGQLCNLKRADAKQVNFAQVYGQGIKALAELLNKTESETKIIRNIYFSKLRKVQKLIYDIKNRSETRGYITNWFGRRLICPSRSKSYKMLNHYIQGGCGDVCKISMNRIESKNIYGTQQLIQIHDELLFEVDNGYEINMYVAKEIMEKAYPHISLPLTVGIDYSPTDWHNKDKYEAH